MPKQMLMRCPYCKQLVIFAKQCKCGKTIYTDENYKEHQNERR